VHPFRRWLSDHGLNCEDAEQLCYSSGTKTSAAYLRQIVAGHRRPSYELAKALSEITAGAVPPLAFLDYERAA
jgi:hypothetical protein